ncbi:hypothetical protein GCM10023063_46630 [Arthrobacter methylotrophus]
MGLVGTVGEEDAVEIFQGEAAAQLERDILDDLFHVLLHGGKTTLLDEHQATPDASSIDKCRVCQGENLEIMRKSAKTAITFRVACLTADLFWKHSPPQKKAVEAFRTWSPK